MRKSTRAAKIEIRKIRPPADSRRKPEWRWRWFSANALIIGASSEGYIDKADAIKNLETISGGKLTIIFRQRGPKGDYCQGELNRWVARTAAAEVVHVEVLP